MRCSFAVLDELAEHTNRDLYDAIRLSMSKRDEPILFTISTAGYNKTSGAIGWETYSYSKAIIDGTIKDDFEFLPIVYEKLDGDWTDIETYKSCNPSWAETTKQNFFKQLIIEAKNEPNKENAAQVFI
ncbi:MAG: terminase large subunit [Planctomycetaceae bacterium]